MAHLVTDVTMTNMNEKEINKLKMGVIGAGKILLRDNLVMATSGNVSVRIPNEDRLLITPTTVEYDKITIDDIVTMDLEGNVLEGTHKPSSEFKMHIALYKARPDIGAVIHTHSIYASALACSGESIPPFIEVLIPAVGGKIEVAEYGLPGSEELAKNAVKALGDKNAVLLSNHGVLCCGKNLEWAMAIAGLTERFAQVYILASIKGKPRNMPPEAVEAEKKFVVKEQ